MHNLNSLVKKKPKPAPADTGVSAASSSVSLPLASGARNGSVQEQEESAIPNSGTNGKRKLENDVDKEGGEAEKKVKLDI